MTKNRSGWLPFGQLLGGLLLFFAFSLCAVEAGWWADNRPWPEQGDHYLLQATVHTQHWESKEEYVDHPWYVGLQLRKPNNSLWGLALFENSFGQFSQYLYYGKKFMVPRTGDHLYAKLTGGLLHGYDGEFDDRIPYNDLGVAPAILPILGVEFGWLVSEIVFLGNAGASLTVGVEF